jgi:hypothetical protein
LTARKLIEMAVSMMVGNGIYAVGKYAMMGGFSPVIFDAAFWQLSTLLIVWICRKELAG